MKNMRRNGIALAGIVFVFLSVGCSKKMGEQDYLQEAQKYLNSGRYHEAIALYEEFLERFPGSEFAPKSLFMSGFIYANNLQDYENARKCYEQFLATYPGHELASSVQWEVENLGADVNQLIGEEGISGDSAEADSAGNRPTGGAAREQ